MSLETSAFAENGDWVTIAILRRVRGNRGELAATPLSSRIERYQELKTVYLFGNGAPHEVDSVWLHGDRLIFKFKGIDTISAAEPLQGAEVRVPRRERAMLDHGEYYQSDLIGCEVVEKQGGRRLGRVVAWHEMGGPGLLEVEGGLMIPFARSICLEIDPAARRIVVELPEGLEELSRP